MSAMSVEIVWLLLIAPPNNATKFDRAANLIACVSITLE